MYVKYVCRYIQADETRGSSICNTHSMLCPVLENSGGIPLELRALGRCTWNTVTDIHVFNVCMYV